MHPTISTSTVTTDVHFPLHSCFTCHQPCRTHLIILPSHTRWLKVPEKDIPSMALSHKPSVMVAERLSDGRTRTESCEAKACGDGVEVAQRWRLEIEAHCDELKDKICPMTVDQEELSCASAASRMETGVDVSALIQEQNLASEIREELRRERDLDEFRQSSGTPNNSESNLKLTSLVAAGKSVEFLKTI